MTGKRRAAYAALMGALCPLVTVGGAAAEEMQTQGLPLWELRLGATALYGPDYPGADQSRWRGVGAPLFVYRGDRLRIGSEEPNAVARAIAIETRRFQLDLSADAAFGADSDDNHAREDMPDLDPVVEIGPQAVFNLVDNTDAGGRDRLRFLFPVRYAGATDFKSYEDLGLVVQPTLHFRHYASGERRRTYTAAIGATWAAEGVQDYYYEVEPQYANGDRAAYDAEGGFMGAYAQLSTKREVGPGFNLYLSYRLRNFAGAVNEDSPLHLEETTQSFSVSAVWTLLRSDRAARSREE